MRINLSLLESPKVNALPDAPARDLQGAPSTFVRSGFWRALAIPGVRQNLIILTVFWIYVGFSNVLYASAMEQSMMMGGQTHMFAPANARFLQHLFLYPALLGFAWASLRI